MSTAVAYAQCPEPPRAAPAARVRASSGLRVRVPLRLVVGPQYADAALVVYVKIAALAMRPEGCTAKVETIAGYLDMSKSAVERALRDLSRPDAVDGLIEVPTVRRTLPGGRGESAQRTVRTAEPDEGYVWIPARAAGAMTPRLLRLYALIAYATVRSQPLSVGDLGGMLYHHSGASKGQHLGERQTARLVDDLAATGWITKREREGLQGRHAYEAHMRPLQSTAAAPDIHDGSGPDDHDGSLSEEDHRTDRLEKTAVGGGIRRRRSTSSRRAHPVDNRSPSATMRDTFGRGQSEKRSSTGGPGDGTGADIPARVWQVLEPVRHLLGDVRPFVLRRITDEVSRQLAEGTGQRRLTERLTRRYASTDPPRDAGRWILGAGLVRHGCGLAACESGVIWHSGQDCQVCLDIALDHHQAPRAQQPDEQPPPAPTPTVPVPWTPRPAADTGLRGLTRDQKAALRAVATTDTVRAAVEQYGRAGATYLYGHALVLPYLHALDRPQGDDHAH